MTTFDQRNNKGYLGKLYLVYILQATQLHENSHASECWIHFDQ